MLDTHELWERLIDIASGLRDDAISWATGRNALVRLPLLAYLTYAGIRHSFDPMYRSWFAALILVFHEMGHLIFSPFPRTLYILGGTIFQLFTPAAAGVYLLIRQRDYFGVGVCAAWLSYAVWDMATYVGDANKDLLPLVGFGNNPEHDWGTLLTQWHVLNHCDAFATALRVLAFSIWALAIALSVWLCRLMWNTRQA